MDHNTTEAQSVSDMDMEFLERGEFELLTMKERLDVLYNFYTLEEKGLYLDPDFWPKLASRINADKELGDLPYVTGPTTRAMVNFLLNLGMTLMTFEEQYFEDYGHHYEEDMVPTYEEDMEEYEDHEESYQ